MSTMTCESCGYVGIDTEFLPSLTGEYWCPRCEYWCPRREPEPEPEPEDEEEGQAAREGGTDG